MEYRQLLHFLAACEEKSFSGAAKRCNISPQGLSLSIKQLEEQLEVSLFFRNPQGIETTEFGRILHQAAYLYTNHHDRIISEIQDVKLKIASSVSVALTDGLYENFPSGFFDNFMSKYPDIDVGITSFSPDACQTAMAERNIPIGFSGPPINTGFFDSICSNRYKMYLVAGKEHPLANRSSIKLVELRNYKVIMVNSRMYPQSIIMELCEREGIRPSIFLGNGDISLYHELCSAGRAVSFWAGLMNSVPDLVNIAIDEFDSIYHEMHLIVNQHVHLTDATHKFIAYAKEHVFSGNDAKIYPAPQKIV
jgi:DNA-binding transcriptional LysR family regulator